MQLKENIEQGLAELKGSIRPDKDLFFTLILDIFFYITTAALFISWNMFIYNKAEVLGSYQLSARAAEKASALFPSVVFFIFISSIVVSILFFLIYAYFKGLVWCRLAQKKLSLKLWAKMLMISISLLFPYFIILIIFTSSSGIKGMILSAIIFPIFYHIYLTSVFNLFNSKKPRKVIRKSAKEFFKSLSKLILPYFYSILILAIINRIIYAISILGFGIFWGIVFLIIATVWITWSRRYFFEVLKHKE